MNRKLSELERWLHVPQEHAAATGYFLFVFSNIEEELNHAVWALLNVGGETGGHVITTAVRDTGQRMRLLAKLGKARLTDAKNRQDCTLIIKAFEFVNGQRVDLVHGTFYGWEPIDETVRLQRWKDDGTVIKPMLSRFSTDYLCELALYAMALNEAILKFRHNVRNGSALTLPLLDKRPQPSPPAGIK